MKQVYMHLNKVRENDDYVILNGECPEYECHFDPYKNNETLRKQLVRTVIFLSLTRLYTKIRKKILNGIIKSVFKLRMEVRIQKIKVFIKQAKNAEDLHRLIEED